MVKKIIEKIKNNNVKKNNRDKEHRRPKVGTLACQQDVLNPKCWSKFNSNIIFFNKINKCNIVYLTRSIKVSYNHWDYYWFFRYNTSLIYSIIYNFINININIYTLYTYNKNTRI